MDNKKKVYQKPTLQKLGHIAQVTQKSGTHNDGLRTPKTSSGGIGG